MRDALFALGPDVKLTILDILEQGDLVAVRWQVSGIEVGGMAAMMAIYRFRDGLIVDDFGLTARAAWQR